jgi:hypothetical protein
MPHFNLDIQWPVRENSSPITHATFSCDSQLIYASFMDATVGIFNASSLGLQCRILPASYLPPSIRYFVMKVYTFFRYQNGAALGIRCSNIALLKKTSFIINCSRCLCPIDENPLMQRTCTLFA